MKRTLHYLILFHAATALPLIASEAVSTNAVAPAATRDVMLNFLAADGTPLAGKLTLPAHAKGPVPALFYLHGAGPATHDKLFGYRDASGQRQTGRYLDFHAAELTRRGIALFRMSKRGCHQLADPLRMRIERSVFSNATPAVLLADYQKGLDILRGRPEIDVHRIVLMGSSEGTRLAPRLAQRSPVGVRAVVMLAYAEDSTKDTIIWQNSVGPWRNIQHMLPAARDGELTRAEYDAAVAKDPTMARGLSFTTFDVSADGTVGPEEVARVLKPRLEAILKAVEDRNDGFLWQHLVNLSSAYLLEDWNAVPNHATLLALDIPLGIFHGELDGTTRVEGVRDAQAAFLSAGRTNLAVQLYPDGNHDLNWTWHALHGESPRAFREVFDFIAAKVK